MINFKNRRAFPAEMIGVRTKSKKSDCALRQAEQALRRLQNVSFNSARSFTSNDVQIESFAGWKKYAAAQTDPDVMRNVIYYCFQPLFDALVSDAMNDGLRKGAIDTLDNILDMSTGYLVSYYTGEPDVNIVKSRLGAIESGLSSLRRVEYTTKFRNIDCNQIYPLGVHSFLVKFMECAIERKFQVPDYIIGCACGASELALPLAGLLGVPADFIRRSYRRGDDVPRVIPEQEPRIIEMARGRKVACVEDYVCTGKSLKGIMKQTAKYGSAKVIGVSHSYSAEGDYLRVLENGAHFSLFAVWR